MYCIYYVLFVSLFHAVTPYMFLFLIIPCKKVFFPTLYFYLFFTYVCACYFEKLLSFYTDVLTQNNIKEDTTPARSSAGMYYKRHANPRSQRGDYSICMCRSQELSPWTRGKERERETEREGRNMFNVRSM